MRLRALCLMLLATATVGSTSGCGVAETIVMTTHMRHGEAVRDYDPSKLRAKEPSRRAPVDVPAEPESPSIP